MNTHQTLHMAHWGLRKGYITLNDLLQTQQPTNPPNQIHPALHITTREHFKGIDAATGKRSPVLVSGEIGLTRTRRTERLQWDVPQALDDILQWIESEPGQPWKTAPIWLFIPKTEAQTLLWAVQGAITQHFQQQNRPCPDTLLIIETDAHRVVRQLLATFDDRPQIIITADSLLDSEYVNRQTDLATEISGDGRILAEAVAWVALTPNASDTPFHAQLITDTLMDDKLNQLAEHCHSWQTQHYRVGEPLLLQYHLPTSPEREWNYTTQCLPSSTMPSAPNPKDKRAVKAFKEALDSTEIIEHQTESHPLHLTLGDTGLANTLAGLVMTLEQLKQSDSVNTAMLFQESAQNGCHFLIHQEAC